MLGQRVNNFEVVRLLGEGGMGAVYEAKHPLIDKRVAIKVLKPELAVDAELVQRFFNEARATSAIRHANIVEVIDLGQLAGGTPYLIMELLEGESLGQRLERVGKLEIPLALDFARQAANALEAAHTRGIVHRDLKPDNLFLVPDQRLPDRELVKVLDFGIAKLRGEQPPGHINTIAGTVLGTPPYMSPEQCRGLPEMLDHRTDIYSLGVILYEMLCGHTPFEGEGMGDVMMLHMSAPPPPPSALRPELPAHLEQVILRALAKRREERFTSMAELRAALGPSASPIVVLADAAPPRVSTLAFAVGQRPSPIPAVLERARPVSGTSERSEGVHAARGAQATAVEASAAVPVPVALRGELEAAATLRSAPGPQTLQGAGDEATDPGLGARDAARRRTALWLVLAAGALAAGAWWLAPAPRRAEPGKDFSPGATSAAATAAPASKPVAEAAPAPIVLPPVAAPPVHEPAEPEAVSAHEPRSHSSRSASAAARAARRNEAAASAAASVPAPASTAVVPALPRTVSVGEPLPPAVADVKLAPGFLSLDSSPWANVYLGAKLLGTTPLMHVALPPGRHVLTLQNPELDASTSYVVEIKPGGTLSRLVGWEKK